MEVDKGIIPGLRNGTRIYSPLTLSSEIPTLVRLIFMVFCSCYGSIMCGYFVSSFFVELGLRYMCYVYHGCAGLADILIVSFVLPLSSVVLLSGVLDSYPVCQIAQVLATAASYSYSIFYALLAVETCYSVFTWTDNKHQRTSSSSYSSFVLRTCIVITVFLVSFVLASLGTYFHLDYDYCQRRFYGNFYFRYTTSALLGICCFLTIGALTASYIRIEKMKRQRIQNPTFDVKLYRTMIILNMGSYIVHVAFWIPYIIMVYVYPNAKDKEYYYCAWLGISRPLITSTFYALLSTKFGEAYSNIYLYCCCKASLHNYNAPRPRHRQCNRVRSGGVSSERTHTHIMQIAVNPHNPQRASTSARDREALDF